MELTPNDAHSMQVDFACWSLLTQMGLHLHGGHKPNAVGQDVKDKKDVLQLQQQSTQMHNALISGANLSQALRYRGLYLLSSVDPVVVVAVVSILTISRLQFVCRPLYLDRVLTSPPIVLPRILQSSPSKSVETAVAESQRKRRQRRLE